MTPRSQRTASSSPSTPMTAPSGELGPTQKSTGDTSSPTSTSSRSSSTSGGIQGVHDKDRRRGIQPQRNSASPSSAEAGDLAPALPEQRHVPGSHLRPSPHVVGAHPVRGRSLQEASQPDACHGGLALGGLERHPFAGLSPLIRSVLDYGSIAYESASTTQKKVLDTIQCKALTIASGALRGTSLAALQFDCGEMPHHLRRKQQMMEFVMKVEAIPDHPTQTITVGRKLKTAKDDTDPTRVKARQITNEIAAPKIQRLACATKPTWTLRPPVIDTTLREVVRGEGDPTRRRTLVEDHIHTLGAFKEATRDGDVSHQRRAHVEGQTRTDEGVSTAIYTDGSRNNQGNTSCAFYVPSHDLRRSYRMTDGSSVLAAEMEAIGRAIEWATTANIPHVIVFSDSLGVVESLENQRSGKRPRQLMELRYALNDYAVRTKSSPTIVWIPGHLGIQGNETADDLCKRALHHDAVDIPTTLEYREARTIYRDFFLGKGRAEWATSDTGSHYRALEPTVSLARKEVAINRLRLGHSCLNHQLHLWGRHAY